jgi:hypothetical protein
MSDKSSESDDLLRKANAMLLEGKRIQSGGSEFTYIDDETPETDNALEPFLIEVGKIATNWSLFELALDELIWKLAGVGPHIGACLTAQFGSTYIRFKVLAAIVGLWPGADALVSRINKFSRDAEPMVRKRNRSVHDPLLYGLDIKKVVNYRITAERKLDIGIALADLEEYKNDRIQIDGLRKDFEPLSTDILTFREALKNELAHSKA